MAKIRKYIQQDKVIEQMINDKIEQKLNILKKDIRCICPDTKGDKGAPGPKGEQGPRGERGLGLYPPRLVNKTLNSRAEVGEERSSKLEKLEVGEVRS